MADVTAPAENRDSLNGFLFALSAYLLWGFLPLYMKAMAHISPAEVIAHRILWSVPVAGLLLLVIRQTDDLKKAIRNPRMLGMAAVTATLISVNWGIYVWAIGAGHALDTALGYFINPLFSILLGAVILKEKLKKTQIAALALVVLAVVILTVEAGRLPIVALALTFSWGFYAFFRKTLPIGPNQGFLLEVLLLSPIALGYLVYLNLFGEGSFPQGQYDGYAAACVGRLRHGRAADPLCQWRQTAQAFDHRHHAVHRSVDDLQHRRLRLPRAVQPRQGRRLPADLGGTGDLHTADAEAPLRRFFALRAWQWSPGRLPVPRSLPSAP